MNKKPELNPVDKNPQEYDLIFIGTPVWAWNPAPPLKSFLSSRSIMNKKIALFCCHGGGKGKIFKRFKELLPGNQILGEIDFFEPLKKNRDTCISKTIAWAQSLSKNPS